MSAMIIAIDPGVAGGFAWGIPGGELTCEPMPPTEGDTLALLQHAKIRAGDYPIIAVMEQLTGWFPKFRRKSDGQDVAVPSANAFALGVKYGMLQGMVMALGIRLEMVTARKWQKITGLSKEGLSRTEWKGKLKALAQRLYPDVKITLKTADALLIYEWKAKTIDRRQPELLPSTM